MTWKRWTSQGLGQELPFSDTLMSCSLKASHFLPKARVGHLPDHPYPSNPFRAGLIAVFRDVETLRFGPTVAVWAISLARKAVHRQSMQNHPGAIARTKPGV